MTVLAQIASWMPDKIVENLARKHKIQTPFLQRRLQENVKIELKSQLKNVNMNYKNQPKSARFFFKVS